MLSRKQWRQFVFRIRGSPKTRFSNFLSQDSLMFLGARHGFELARGDAHGADRGRRSTMSANTIYTEKRFTRAVRVRARLLRRKLVPDNGH